MIGVNGLAGNLGVAGAALLTGFLVQSWGWRAAFVVPGLVSIGCASPSRVLSGPQGPGPGHASRRRRSALPPALLARALVVMTAAAITGSLLFNFTTNGNTQLLSERFRGLSTIRRRSA